MSTHAVRDIMHAEARLNAERRTQGHQTERRKIADQIRRLPLPEGLIGHQVMIMPDLQENQWLGSQGPVVDSIVGVHRSVDNGRAVVELAKSPVQYYLYNGAPVGFNTGMGKGTLSLPPAGMSFIPTKERALASITKATATLHDTPDQTRTPSSPTSPDY